MGCWSLEVVVRDGWVVVLKGGIDQDGSFVVDFEGS